ncbi:MAG: hypothetical protein PVG87_12130, partial [Desulfobacteraceae bacterium]
MLSTKHQTQNTIMTFNPKSKIRNPQSKGPLAIVEAILKIGFWFKIPSSPRGYAGTGAAGPSFPAERDFPSDLII